ncbi:MAG: hypothetical protein ACXW14_07465, partial [Burkholderiaceae bacterium]
MKKPAALLRLFFSLVPALVLAACGSGDSTTPAPAPGPVVPPSIAPSPTCTGTGIFSIVADTSVAV